MNTVAIIKKYNTGTIIFDILALSVIYFMPAFVHLFAFPVYFIEPMRLFVVISMIQLNKKNAYFLALTLPVFSFIISTHPVIYKSLIMTAELLLNVFLFFSLSSFVKNVFVRMTVSVLVSKIVYYLLKYVFMSFALINGDFIATPFLAQITVLLLLSLYAQFMYNRKQN